MKKLMIAAAIVCAAAFANAAVFNWSGSLTFIDVIGEAPAAGSVEFFFNGASLGTATIGSDGVASFGSYALDDWGTVSAVATITNFGAEGNETGTKAWSKAIDSAWFADQGNDEGVGNSALVDAMNGQFQIEDLSQSAASNGYTPVPEPTSGLLLLLGMAGLALKRKRA